MELCLHIIHLRIIFSGGATVVSTREKLYSRRRRVAGCGFFGVLQIGSAMQQSFSADIFV